MMPRKAVILVDSLSCACRLQQTHFSFVDRDLVLDQSKVHFETTEGYHQQVYVSLPRRRLAI